MLKPIVIILLVMMSFWPAAAQPEQLDLRLLSLPVADEPGPATWLLGQPYGNTTGAYNFGTQWYGAGQGLHFGVDLSMPCGTPLLAMADGIVRFVDDFSFGSRPHNLLIEYPEAGVIALYGHLNTTAPVIAGQSVTRGQVVGFSGDPDATCDSRPHLHLEIRSLNYRTTYNPVNHIATNWHNLAVVGSFGYPLFQGDMDNARRWMSLEDQPDVSFGGVRLNAYTAPFPPPNALRPPPNPPLARPASPLSDGVIWRTRQVGFDRCCWMRWWHPTDPARFYVIDGTPGQRANLLLWSAETGAPKVLVGQAPPPYYSPDGTHEIINNGGQITIRRLSDGATWTVVTGGPTPAVSTDNARLTWTVSRASAVPGQPSPPASVYVSDLSGANTREIISQPGVSAQWLDATHLLIVTPGAGRTVTLAVYDTLTDTGYTLGTWRWMRGLSVAPGGGRLLFYLTYQTDPAESGIYTIETHPEAQAVKLNWFGGWRWRDADSVYYIPLDTAAPQTLRYYEIPSGRDTVLTDPAQLPFTVMNGDWSVSADGTSILFQNAADQNLWLLEMQP